MIDGLRFWIQRVLPLVYDDSLSYLELLSKVVAKINELTDATNAYLSQDLQAMVDSILTGWVGDGTIEAIISDALQTQIDTVESNLTNLTATVDAKINKDSFVYADRFAGATDLIKLQTAIDYCLNNSVYNLILNRAFDLTGGSIKIPIIQGLGFTIKNGSLIKHDIGFMFEGNDSLIGENNYYAPWFDHVQFSATANVSIFKGMIRQRFNKCSFSNIDVIRTADYLQSVYCRDSDFYNSFLCFFSGATMYDGDFVGNRFEANNKKAFEFTNDVNGQISFMSLRIMNNLFESYSAFVPIILSGGYGLRISGNYFEANAQGDIKLTKPLNRVSWFSGDITSNIHSGSNMQNNIIIDNLVTFNWLTIANNTTNITGGTTSYVNRNFPDPLKNVNYNSPSIRGLIPAGTVVSDESNGFVASITDLNPGISITFPVLFSGVVNNSCRSYLLNVKSTYGSAVSYGGFLTGILSLVSVFAGDVHYIAKLKIIDSWANDAEMVLSDLTITLDDITTLAYNSAATSIKINIPKLLYNENGGIMSAELIPIEGLKSYNLFTV